MVAAELIFVDYSSACDNGLLSLFPNIMLTPTEIILHQKSKSMEIIFNDGARFDLPAEYLRVHSPSAEVRGHGPGQETLQVGKRDVALVGIEAAGSYALKLVFDDNHDSGLYDWDLLYKLGKNQKQLWQDYLARMEAAGESRDPTKNEHVVRPEPPKGGCY
jgi:DUF971 family protein